MAEGGEVEAVGDVGECEATVFEQVREFHGGVAVDPVVGRLAADALTDFRDRQGSYGRRFFENPRCSGRC